MNTDFASPNSHGVNIVLSCCLHQEVCSDLNVPCRKVSTTSPSMTSEVISAGLLGLHNTTLNMECAQCGTSLSISLETDLFRGLLVNPPLCVMPKECSWR